jgi:hypothetical protein
MYHISMPGDHNPEYFLTANASLVMSMDSLAPAGVYE